MNHAVVARDAFEEISSFRVTRIVYPNDLVTGGSGHMLIESPITRSGVGQLVEYGNDERNLHGIGR